MSREQAIAIIKRSGSARTPLIAREIGMTPPDVELLLRQPCEQGLLISCEVEIGDGERVTEYRLSTVGGATHTYRPPNKPVHRAAVKTPAAEIRVSTPAPADAERETEVKPATFKDKVSEIFRKHGPLTSRELKKHHGIADASRLLMLIAGNGEFAKLGGTPKNTIYGLPDQELSDRKVDAGTPSGDKPPRSIHRAKHRKAAKHAKKRAGGGSVAMRRKPALKRAKKPFRPALAADGAILLLGAKGGDFEIPREQARALVDINRRLTGQELTDLVMFVTRLDNAEVGA